MRLYRDVLNNFPLPARNSQISNKRLEELKNESQLTTPTPAQPLKTVL